MPKIKSTYADLYQRQLNLLSFRNQFYALCAILPAIRTAVMKYERFNSIPLKFLADKEKELISLHVVHENGVPLWEEETALRIAGSLQTNYRGQNNLVPVFIDSDHARQFNDEWVELLNKPIEITI